MDVDTVRMLVDYSFTTHRKVWDCAAGLPDDAYQRDFGYAFGSVHGQFVHILASEEGWLARMRDGAGPDRLLGAQDFPTRDALRARWDETETHFREFVWSLSDADLRREFDYTTIRGEPFRNTIGHILLHVVNHGTDTRAQILFMLHRLEAPTVAQDLLAYMR